MNHKESPSMDSQLNRTKRNPNILRTAVAASIMSLAVGCKSNKTDVDDRSTGNPTATTVPERKEPQSIKDMAPVVSFSCQEGEDSCLVLVTDFADPTKKGKRVKRDREVLLDTLSGYCTEPTREKLEKPVDSVLSGEVESIVLDCKK